jgi:tetratricopeptide (TPR) repeat protein
VTYSTRVRSVQIDTLAKSKLESDREKCILLLHEYLETNLSEAKSWFDLACCLDFLGRELEAEPAYERVLALGAEKLDPKDQSAFYLGYGSTLRNNEKFEEAKRILCEGTKKFPKHLALKVFLALTYYSVSEHKEANKVLFEIVGDLPHEMLDGYDRAIGWYTQNL